VHSFTSEPAWIDHRCGYCAGSRKGVVLVVKVPGVFRNANSVREVKAGEIIFEAGSQGDQMFGVIDGDVAMTMPHGAVHKLGADETFGEMAVVDSSPRSATAVALTDTRLAVIDRRTFLFLVHETPMFALQVMSSLAERLRSLG
jgi:CRP/FNR family cyclic AMP-dependent transcriptional regulator